MGMGNIANSGMQTSMSDMEIISNNIANANTYGFKRAYAKFADVYASSNGTASPGVGVQMTGIHQDFSRGGPEASSSNSHLMINDNKRFFVLKDTNSGVRSYTRNGEFSLDTQGYINNGNLRLQGYPATNGVLGSNLSDIKISRSDRQATATTSIKENFTIAATADIPTGPFNTNDPTTYNAITNDILYDSLGNTHSLTTYYIKTAPNTWTSQVYVDGTQTSTGTINFSSNGKFVSATGMSNISFNPGGGAVSPQAFSIELSNCLQLGKENKIGAVTQNGYPVGSFKNFQIDSNGNINAEYSNDERILVGKIALAEFEAPDALASIGNMSWIETAASGSPVIAASLSDKNITSNFLEASNVNLTQEMIHLISRQQSFQANAQVEQIYNDVIQTVIKL